MFSQFLTIKAFKSDPPKAYISIWVTDGKFKYCIDVKLKTNLFNIFGCIWSFDKLLQDIKAARPTI